MQTLTFLGEISGSGEDWNKMEFGPGAKSLQRFFYHPNPTEALIRTLLVEIRTLVL